MKELNVMKYVSEVSREIKSYIETIGNVETMEKAQKTACRAMGVVDGLILMSNTMICFENNDFTAMMSELEDDFCVEIYQALATVALEKFKDHELFEKYAAARDELRK